VDWKGLETGYQRVREYLRKAFIGDKEKDCDPEVLPEVQNLTVDEAKETAV
jgi:hypothetical protein